MACFHEVVHSECDYEEEGGSMPEDKHWFSDCSLDLFHVGAGPTTRYVTGFRPWFSSSSFRGADDKRVQGPLYNDGGRPVIGNYLLPKRFSVKLCVRTGLYSLAVAANTLTGSVSNSLSFRLIFLLVWLYPPTSSNENDEEEFFENLYMVYPGVARLHSFLKPEVKEQVKVLYDAVHTVSSPKEGHRGVYGVVTKAVTNVPAYAQAGYVVPAPSGTLGWVVPAAAQAAYTDTAVSTAVGNQVRDVYGGHQIEVQECIDLEGLQVSTWRDPVGEEENQMVPYMQMFIVTDEAFCYNTASNPTREWSLNVQGQTCMSFTDE